MDIKPNSEKTSFRFQRLVALFGVLLFLGKLIAWRITHSDAIFSDAMESIVNIIAAFMGLYSLYLASKPKDKEHPYGHGKVEFITSGIEGALIIFAGIVIIIQSVNSLINKNTPQQLDWGMVIIAITALINYLLGYISVQKGIKEKSLVLQSSGKHLQSDTITTVGVVVSLLIVYITKIYWLDGIIASIFGLYIIFVGYKIVRQSLSGIMDEADDTMLTKLASILNDNRKEEWIDFHNVKIQQFGSRLHIDGHLTLPYYFELRRAHNEMEEAILTVVKHAERQIEFNFHMDDCKPTSCQVCLMNNCPVRSSDFKKKIEWNAQNITQADKHTIEN